MELHATGLNAWNQLDFSNPSNHGEHEEHEEHEDISTFTCILSTGYAITCIRSFLSYIAVYTDPSLPPKLAGSVPHTHQYLLTTQPQIHRHIAEASNNLVVVHDGSGPTLQQHTSLASFLLNQPFHTLSAFPDPVIQLLAYETGFIALTSAGQVYTWGDERYSPCLGREVTGSFPASTPGLVADLLDLPTGPVTSIAAGGYTLAALTMGNDLYLWGDSGRSAALSELKLSSRPEPAVIGNEEGKDVASVAVGNSHLVVLTTDGEVYAIGDNTNGQLGISGEASARFWTRVSINLPDKRAITAVEAGPKNSFLLVK
ncbi:E3 ubiquitin-protein ligase HERC2 [Cladorrhinum samala]|uniref:E3 ubiquitin-protein ligase HERC2 n=1 Tax=Cladorrhinum samala TaxID=585594 RepID=A0AAV9HJ89_9PEZI|nr:E3 ubiquitin-protein ligase HERC2 [Cladorrhinum samala]